MAQQMQAGSCIPVGIQLEKAQVGPTSGPTWRLSHFEVGDDRRHEDIVRPALGLAQGPGRRR
jgi:hypothetical protein